MIADKMIAAHTAYRITAARPKEAPTYADVVDEALRLASYTSAEPWRARALETMRAWIDEVETGDVVRARLGLDTTPDEVVV